MPLVFKEELNTQVPGSEGYETSRRDLDQSRAITAPSKAGVWCQPAGRNLCKPFDTDETPSVLGGVLLKINDKMAEFGDVDYVQGDRARVLRHGYVTVRIEGPVSDDDDVFIRHAAPGTEDLGACANADSEDHVQHPTAKFVGDHSGESALVYIP